MSVYESWRALFVTIDAGTGNDVVNVLGTNPGITLNVKGGAGTNTLTAGNGTNAWHITGNNSGDVNGTFSFSNFPSLHGSAGQDTFVFGVGGNLTGTINGGVYNVLDTLVGANTPNAWNITSGNAGTLNGIAFLNLLNLTGGTLSDTFKFAATTGYVDGKLTGGGGTDTLDYSARPAGVSVNLSNATGSATFTHGVSGIANVIGTAGNDSIIAASAGSVITANGGTDILVGGAGNDAFLFGSTQGAGTTVNGGGGTNTLVGPANANTWNVTGTNSGSLNGIPFQNFQNLTGGALNDTFKFGANLGSVSGTITGGGGSDTLDYSARSAAIVFNLQTNSFPGVAAISGITGVIGGSSASNLLYGPNGTNTWHVTGTNSGDINGTMSFNNFPSLHGSAGQDTFVFGVGGNLTGSINGGVYNALDALVGANTANTWNITSGNAGTLNGIPFLNLLNLTGGTVSDTFKFGATTG